MRKVLVLLTLLVALTLPLSGASAQEIDFLWQGDTYTHPFYEGRSLWTSQSKITVLAVPSIPGIQNTSSLIYKWSQNGTVLGGERGVNGVGRNSLTFTDSILGKPQEIHLEILSGDGKTLASGSINLTAKSPSLLVYESNPLYGILFHREASKGYSIGDREVTFAVFPFSFNTSTRLGGQTEYVWRTNLGDKEVRSEVTYRAPEGISGTSQVIVEVKHKENITQYAKGSFLVQFGN